MKDSALSAYDQIKGLALDKLKEALGLPTFLNDPPCSLTAPSYTPNVNGIKKGLSSTVKHLPQYTGLQNIHDVYVYKLV